MRGGIGLAMGVAVAVALGAASGVAGSLGCSHDARPAVKPDEPPPLPPASGTPIGTLIDAADSLHLRDSQLTHLQGIDQELSAQLAALDSELRTPDPVPASNLPDKPRGLGFQAGGVHDGMGGATSGFPGAPGGSSGGGAAPGPVMISADTVNHVHRKQAADIREAIRRALALLDADQQTFARRVLTEHGVDPDTGETTGGEPAAPRSGEP